MIDIDHVISDLLIADPDMSLAEMYDHCVRIGRINGLTENQVREKFTVNAQLKVRNGN
jgi:hypothetical protein